jgi:glycosyltransferase involved in cell wall biosynthesis
VTKTIAIIDWNWGGHHPVYFTHFAAALAESGAEVIPFCADPKEFTNRLTKLSLHSTVLSHIASAEKAISPWSSSFRPARWRRHYDTYRFFQALGKQLDAWEQLHNRQIDLAFFACIYDIQFEFFRFAERSFGYCWAGLYLHARSFRLPGSLIPHTGRMPCPEKIFSSSTLRAVAVLDEGAVKPMQKITNGKPVLVFPDFTEDSLPANTNEKGLIQKIHTFASGRPIISLIGHLHWTKGLTVFTEAARHPSLNDCFFFLGGELSWADTAKSIQLDLQHAWETAPNILTHFQRITSESTLNSIIDGSDIISASYISFPNSSNILTKAAFFEKPVVVSDGFLMAERVREFHLGEIIPEGDSEALAGAIRRILALGYREELRKRARWEAYRQLHSLDRLKKAMHEVVAIA